MKVKLNPTHPGAYVKVNVPGRQVYVSKRFTEFDDELAPYFKSSSLIVEGVSKPVEPVKQAAKQPSQNQKKKGFLSLLK